MKINEKEFIGREWPIPVKEGAVVDLMRNKGKLITIAYPKGCEEGIEDDLIKGKLSIGLMKLGCVLGYVVKVGEIAWQFGVIDTNKVSEKSGEPMKLRDTFNYRNNNMSVNLAIIEMREDGNVCRELRKVEMPKVMFRKLDELVMGVFKENKEHCEIREQVLKLHRECPDRLFNMKKPEVFIES